MATDYSKTPVSAQNIKKFWDNKIGLNVNVKPYATNTSITTARIGCSARTGYSDTGSNAPITINVKSSAFGDYYLYAQTRDAVVGSDFDTLTLWDENNDINKWRIFPDKYGAIDDTNKNTWYWVQLNPTTIIYFCRILSKSTAITKQYVANVCYYNMSDTITIPTSNDMYNIDNGIWLPYIHVNPVCNGQLLTCNVRSQSGNTFDYYTYCPKSQTINVTYEFFAIAKPNTAS